MSKDQYLLQEVLQCLPAFHVLFQVVQGFDVILKIMILSYISKVYNSMP